MLHVSKPDTTHAHKPLQPHEMIHPGSPGQWPLVPPKRWNINASKPMPYLCKGNKSTDFPELISTSISQLIQGHQSNTKGLLTITVLVLILKKVRFVIGRWGLNAAISSTIWLCKQHSPQAINIKRGRWCQIWFSECSGGNKIIKGHTITKILVKTATHGIEI